MSNSKLAVATANNPVLAPVEFTGKVKAVNLLSIKGSNDNPDLREQVFSIEVEGLPSIETKDGRKATIIRTVEQMKRDMRYFAPSSKSVNSLYMTVDTYVVDRDVTFNVSAHEAGALATVTENSSQELIDTHGIGAQYETTSGGFYVDGFLNISFDKADKLAKLAEAERLAELASQATR